MCCRHRRIESCPVEKLGSRGLCCRHEDRELCPLVTWGPPPDITLPHPCYSWLHQALPTPCCTLLLPAAPSSVRLHSTAPGCSKPGPARPGGWAKLFSPNAEDASPGCTFLCQTTPCCNTLLQTASPCYTRLHPAAPNRSDPAAPGCTLLTELSPAAPGGWAIPACTTATPERNPRTERVVSSSAGNSKCVR